MNKGTRFTAAFAGTTFIYEATGESNKDGLPIARIIGHYSKEDLDAQFEKRERLRFNVWYAIYGDKNADKEGQWHGFRGRAHLASKGQNDASHEKEYRVSYSLLADPDQTIYYDRVMAGSPKEAIKKYESGKPGCYAFEARRPMRAKG